MIFERLCKFTGAFACKTPAYDIVVAVKKVMAMYALFN